MLKGNNIIAATKGGFRASDYLMHYFAIQFSALTTNRGTQEKR